MTCMRPAPGNVRFEFRALHQWLTDARRAHAMITALQDSASGGLRRGFRSMVGAQLQFRNARAGHGAIAQFEIERGKIVQMRAHAHHHVVAHRHRSAIACHNMEILQ